MKVRFFLNGPAPDPVLVRNMASTALPRPGDLVDLPGHPGARRVMQVRHVYDGPTEVRVLVTSGIVQEAASLGPAPTAEP
jgi:hypothetical protein